MKKFDTMAPCLESPCRDILQAREASSALETLGQLREVLERVTLSEGQEGGESFIRMTVTDLLTAIEEAQPNGRAAAAISDLRLLPDGRLSSPLAARPRRARNSSMRSRSWRTWTAISPAVGC